MSNAAPTVVIVAQPKSMFVAGLLACLFGPLGMLYVTVPGALIMLVISVILVFLTAGLAAFVLWPICAVWAMLAVSGHNKRIKHSAAVAVAARPTGSTGVGSPQGS